VYYKFYGIGGDGVSLAKRFVFIVSVVLLAVSITADAPFYAQNMHNAQVDKQMMMTSGSAAQDGIYVNSLGISDHASVVARLLLNDKKRF
jgi:uncharacterized protein (UPF0333 family)